MEMELKFGHCARKKCTEPKIAIQAVLWIWRHPTGSVHNKSYAPINELPPATYVLILRQLQEAGGCCRRQSQTRWYSNVYCYYVPVNTYTMSTPTMAISCCGTTSQSPSFSPNTYCPSSWYRLKRLPGSASSSCISTSCHKVKRVTTHDNANSAMPGPLHAARHTHSPRITTAAHYLSSLHPSDRCVTAIQNTLMELCSASIPKLLILRVAQRSWWKRTSRWPAYGLDGISRGLGSIQHKTCMSLQGSLYQVR